MLLYEDHYIAIMNVTVVQNSERPLGHFLQNELAAADEVRIASAFLNRGGLGYVLPEMHRILEGESAINIVHGADFRITEPDAIERLMHLNSRFARMRYRLHFGWDLTQSHRFHPKMFVWTEDYRSYTAVIGSSNLTLGGLINNTEVNTILRGTVDEAPIKQTIGIFDSIIGHPDLIEPSEEFLTKYRVLCEQARNVPFDTEPPSDLLDLYRELEELIRQPFDDWWPRTQLEFVVKALENLGTAAIDSNTLHDAGEHFVHLREIYDEVVRLASEAGKTYDWGAIESSIRGRINENIGNPPEQGSHFIREGNMSGRYRLSSSGRAFARERAKV